MRKLVLVFLVLLAGAAQAQQVTTSVASIWATPSDVQTQMKATVLAGSPPAPLPAASADLAFGFVQTSIAFTVPPQASAYLMQGFRIVVSQQGPGFLQSTAGVYDFMSLVPLTVPAGIQVNVLYNAPLSGMGSWTATLGPDAIPPGTPVNPTAVATGTSTITLSWGASQDNIGVSNYFVERCQGAGCAAFGKMADLHA